MTFRKPFYIWVKEAPNLAHPLRSGNSLSLGPVTDNSSIKSVHHIWCFPWLKTAEQPG